MTPPDTNSVASAQRRILSLAASPKVHRAFHWLHLHQPQMRRWLLDVLAIPAPPFGEAPRAEAMRFLFDALGLANPRLDDAGNALAELPSLPSRPDDPRPNETRLDKTRPNTTSPDQPVLLISAHLDTVFPAGTVCTPREEGSRIYAPGACDNGAGLSALLGLAAALRFAAITPPLPIVFAANVGEEGEGDLRGMRHLLTRGSLARRIAGVLVLEGAGSATAVTRALGSLRFRITVEGPGGHSWTDAGTPNPIFLLARILVALSEIPLPDSPRTTLSVGHIAGGTSVNSIPASATALLDLRSTDPLHLRATADALLARTRDVLSVAGKELAPVMLHTELVGDRPAAELPEHSPLRRTIAAVDRHLGLRTQLRVGSTDANLPLSLGLPAVALSAGGTGDGIHTLGEWYDPAGRETALRRLLLTLLDTADQLAT